MICRETKEPCLPRCKVSSFLRAAGTPESMGMDYDQSAREGTIVRSITGAATKECRRQISDYN